MSDVSDLRSEMTAHTRALNALRATQVELYAKHEADLAEFRGETRAGFAAISELIQTLIDREQQ